MLNRAISLVTVSREFGAGGSEFAAALGALLEWPVLDHDIVHRVASRLRLGDATVEQIDEHPPSLLARIATVLVIPQPDIYSFPPVDESPSHDAIAAAARGIIEEAGATPPLVVVGHGAQCIFARRDHAFHVRLLAPVKLRLARVMRRMDVDPAFAGALLRRADHDRQAYLQRYYHQDWRNELLYDVQLNTARISIDSAARTVAELVKLQGGE